MPLVGEMFGPGFAYKSKNEMWKAHTLSWEIHFPPSKVLARVGLCAISDWETRGSAWIKIDSIRRLLPNNQEEVIVFPGGTALDPVHVFPTLAFYDPKMKSVTVSLSVSGGYAAALWTLGFWQ